MKHIIKNKSCILLRFSHPLNPLLFRTAQILLFFPFQKQFSLMKFGILQPIFACKQLIINTSISLFFPMNKSIVLEQQVNQNFPPSNASKICPKSVAMYDLKNIIEVTDENQTAIEASEQIKQKPSPSTPQSKSWAQRYLRCCSNLWNFLFFDKPKWNYDINEKDFDYHMSKIREGKQQIIPVIPSQRYRRKVLVLDLDETLIYSTYSKREQYDFQTQIEINGERKKVYTSKRFGLEAFLFEMAKYYEIIVFTASHREYANKIIDKIDPKHRISHRLYREHCIVINKVNFIKNIRILGRNLEDIIIVDDNLLGGVLQPQHFYKIQSFRGNNKDRQLRRLADFLKYLHNQQQVIPVQFFKKQFEEMEINLTEGESDCFKDITNVLAKDCGPSKRKREYYHGKKNSEVENLAKQLEEDENAETTASDFIKRL